MSLGIRSNRHTRIRLSGSGWSSPRGSETAPWLPSENEHGVSSNRRRLLATAHLIS